jgi:branched-chain amino acid transport system ATP-binding protein
MLNIVSGLVRPTSGRIYFLDQEITSLPAHKRASLGIGRSFQMNTLFPNLSFLHNVSLAVQGRKSVRLQMLRPLDSYRDILNEAETLLGLVGLWNKRYAPVSTLSHGEQRQVEILLALASKAKLLLMDEPSAGLTTGETVELIKIIQSLAGDITVFFCGHDMDLVFGLADRVMVLYGGQIIADGTREEIQTDPRVSEVYLGTENEDT